MDAKGFEGGCLCGATRFRAAGEATSRCYCHCRSCRLASGAPFVAWATFPTEGFRLLKGQLAEHSSSENVVRSFCPACGTAISYVHEARSARIDVALATLDDASPVAPEFHIWVSHKLSWVSIDDGLPQYPEWREGGTPRGARVRSVIDRLHADGSMIAEADGARHDVRAVSISAREGESLTRWILRERAARTIEIGLAYGVSALHICEGLLRSGDPQARHVALDPFQGGRFANCGLQVLEEAGVGSLVEHHDEMSQIALPAFLKSGRRFDLGFVDGNHRFDSVFLDLFYLGRLLPRGGIVLLDDYDLPGIRRAVSFFLTNLSWRVEETSEEGDDHHWVALRTSEKGDTRDFRYFVDF